MDHHPKDQVSEAFQLFDSDGDGHLLVSEAASAIRALGHILTDHDIKNLLLRVGVDPGRGGRVDLAKFKQMHGSLPAQNYARQLEEAFKTVDKEGSGFVMATELRHLLTNMGDRLSDDDFNILLEQLEIDSNGRIQFKDFSVFSRDNRIRYSFRREKESRIEKQIDKNCMQLGTESNCEMVFSKMKQLRSRQNESSEFVRLMNVNR